jgi:hypothetical protein
VLDGFTDTHIINANNNTDRMDNMEMSGYATALRREFNFDSAKFDSAEKLSMAEALSSKFSRELQDLVRLDLHDDEYLLKNLREAQKDYRFHRLLLDEVKETDQSAYDKWLKG